MSDDSALGCLQQFMQDNARLLGAGALTVAGMTAASFFMTSSPPALTPPIDLDCQSIVLDGEERMRASAFLASDPSKLTTFLYDDAKTTYEAFLRGLRVSNNGRCLGKRSAPGKAYVWLTYKEVLQKAHNFGSGLIAKGVEAKNDTFVGIYSANCVEWAVADLGSQMFSMVPVPLYDTLGFEACKYIINQTELCTVVCDDAAKAARLLDDLDHMPSLKRVILTGSHLPDILTKSRNADRVDIVLFQDVEDLGERNLQEPKPPKPEDIATICYTSGTTGDPKGVIQTHSSIVICLSAVYSQINLVLQLQPSDVHLSYLPLAHTFEREIHTIVFMHGAQIGYFSGDIRKLTEDLMELRPSLFPTVPRLLNRIYDKIQAGVSNSWFKSKLLQLALRSKLRDVKRGVIRNDTLWDRLVFARVQKLLGGRVRVIITGSAPLLPSVLDFIRCAFGCIVLEGFGQTETSGGVTFNVPGEVQSGNVGPPLTCNHVKLVDVPEMDYYAKDDKGEVCCKGGNVMVGYYKNPQKTTEALDKDGWLHTGDIGMWLPNGTLKIIDRKKNIFKLAQGEYVAVEKVENVYCKSKFVGQCFVEGDSLKPCLMAVVVPDEEIVRPYAANNGLPTDLAHFCQSPKAKEIILKDMLGVGKENQLKGFEQVKDIYLHSELFSIDNDLLTPTMKNKRPTLRKTFKQSIDALYKLHKL